VEVEVVTPARERVALVSDPGDTRTALADYLTKVGFDVFQCDELAVPSTFAALILIGRDEEPIESLVGVVRSWMRLGKSLRVVVVTSKPKALARLAASHGRRLRVLPAPAFGWDLVDAVRWEDPAGPRGA
jgi:hypothetical protein